VNVFVSVDRSDGVLDRLEGLGAKPLRDEANCVNDKRPLSQAGGASVR